MNFIVELEQEEDGRWIADIVEIPGAMAYGKTQEEAMAKAETLARIAKRTGLTPNDL
jgi:predicted RNase H-like HicB family nuclease